MYSGPVDSHDFISASEPGLVCRRIHIWLIDNDIALFGRLIDNRADTAVSLADHKLEVLVVLLRNIHRIRIQVFQHRFDTHLFNTVQRQRIYIRLIQFFQYSILNFNPLPQFEAFRLPERRDEGQCKCSCRRHQFQIFHNPIIFNVNVNVSRRHQASPVQ